MNTKKTVTCLFALTGSIASSHATLIAYEGFDTAAANGTDVTIVGVTGSGFSDYVDTDYRYDIEAGLGYSDSSGNTLTSTGRSAGMDVVVSGTQNMQLALNSTITNTGKVYMSFLVDVSSVVEWGYVAGLDDGAVTDTADPTSVNEATFRSSSTNWGIYGDGTDIDARTGPATGTGLFFVVSELNMDTEVMTTWLNPTDLTNVATTAISTITDTASTWDDMTHFLFSLGGDEAGTIDEIRIATTIAEVAPIPEPSTYAMLAGFAALGFAMIRRRR